MNSYLEPKIGSFYVRSSRSRTLFLVLTVRRLTYSESLIAAIEGERSRVVELAPLKLYRPLVTLLADDGRVSEERWFPEMWKEVER
jgi:hypothetical protein